MPFPSTRVRDSLRNEKEYVAKLKQMVVKRCIFTDATDMESAIISDALNELLDQIDRDETRPWEDR